MANKKQDVRVTKTQRSLSQALHSLLESQSFDKITINDICGEAMVSRSTFYAHIEDKYQLLHFSIGEVERHIFGDLRDKELRAVLLVTLENVQENVKILRNLVVAELDIELIEMFRQHFIAIFEDMLPALGQADEVPSAKVEVAASFYAAGVAQTTLLWIAKKLPITTEEMVDTLYELIQGLDRH